MNPVNHDKKELFETMPVGKALLTMAIPTIVSQLITMIYNMHKSVYFYYFHNQKLPCF